MAKTNFESLRVYQLSEMLADQIWTIVIKWNVFARIPSENNLCEQPTALEQISLKVPVAELSWTIDGS